nr:immunoglobulin light chain junction region [Macaca mulatta]
DYFCAIGHNSGDYIF